VLRPFLSDVDVDEYHKIVKKWKDSIIATIYSKQTIVIVIELNKGQKRKEKKEKD
jgi:hypothetical protein